MFPELGGLPIVNEQITLTVYDKEDQNQAEWKDMLVMQVRRRRCQISYGFQEVLADVRFEINSFFCIKSASGCIYPALGAVIIRMKYHLWRRGGQLMVLDDLIDGMLLI